MTPGRPNTNQTSPADLPRAAQEQGRVARCDIHVVHFSLDRAANTSLVDVIAADYMYGTGWLRAPRGTNKWVKRAGFARFQRRALCNGATGGAKVPSHGTACRVGGPDLQALCAHRCGYVALAVLAAVRGEPTRNCRGAFECGACGVVASCTSSRAT